MFSAMRTRFPAAQSPLKTYRLYLLNVLIEGCDFVIRTLKCRSTANRVISLDGLFFIYVALATQRWRQSVSLLIKKLATEYRSQISKNRY